MILWHPLLLFLPPMMKINFVIWSIMSVVSILTHRKVHVLKIPWAPQEIETIAHHFMPHSGDIQFIKGAIEARDPMTSPDIETLRDKIHQDYLDIVFCGITGGSPPIRGPFGEAVIKIKPDAVPVKHRAFHIVGERKDAWVKLTDEILREGKIEPGVSPWNSAYFPVPKKEAR